jgi:membrane peptidoglycan carboxypeptidase
MNKPRKRPLGRRSPVGKNVFKTKSGATFKVHRSLADRLNLRRDGRARQKALRMAGMPKEPLKRLLYRLHPKRMYKYWFSREGGIMALKITGIGLVGGFLLLVGLFAYFRKDLPNLRDISGNNIGGSVLYYDRSGKTLLWEDVDGVKRIPVQNDQMSQFMQDATIAIEDKDFFHHSGFDVRGITRAAWNNSFGDGGRQGGSTITQQLVRLTQPDVSKEQTYQRKIKELILSIELERSYTKQEILTGYLNSAPYGGIEYGVEAAARNYFEKSAKDLNLSESTLLAAIPKSPYYYSPYSGGFDKEDTLGRQHYILDQMVEQGKIDSEQAEKAKKVDVLATVKDRKPRYDGIKAPWFVLAAKEQMEEKFGGQTVKRGGWKVTTTLDLKLQEIAERQVAEGLHQVRRQGGDSAAFVAEDVENGQIVALVGGSDFGNEEYGQNNYARLRLPPGSSFKPYDYLALIEHSDDFGAGSVLYDTKGELPGYPCTRKGLPPPRGTGNCLHDFDFRFPGPMTLRYALGGSRNVPAVKAMLITGVEKTIETATSLGLSGYQCFHPDTADINRATKSDEIPCGASSALGDGAFLKLDEHVHAYGSISRNGRNIPQTYILNIKDAQDDVIEEWKPSDGDQVVRPDSAYITADMMADPNASYFPAGQKIHRNNGWKFSLKTGTTNDAKDGWLMGFSTKYSAGVWVGHHTRQTEMSGFMETMTRPIWNGWMTEAHEGQEPKERERPEGVQEQPAYVIRSHVGLGSIEPSPSTDLYPSWYKKPKAAGNTQRTIDIVSNKLATDCTPQRARKSINEAAAEVFSGDSFVDSRRGANVNASDDVHNCGDAKPNIAFAGGTTNCTAGNCNFKVNVGQGTHPISSSRFPGTVNLIVDGKIVQTVNIGGPGQVTLTYSGGGNGQKQIIAEIIDSVLYDARATATVKFGSQQTQEEDLELEADVNGSGTQVKFSWNSIDGASGYTLCYKADGPEQCSPHSASSTGTGNLVVLPNKDYSATISATGTGKSDTISFDTN